MLNIVRRHRMMQDVECYMHLITIDPSHRFGNLAETMISLWAAVSGGNDWMFYGELLRRLAFPCFSPSYITVYVVNIICILCILHIYIYSLHVYYINDMYVSTSHLLDIEEGAHGGPLLRDLQLLRGLLHRGHVQRGHRGLRGLRGVHPHGRRGGARLSGRPAEHHGGEIIL